MKNNFIAETVLGVGSIVLSLLLLNPWHFWMPDRMVMGIIAFMLVLYGAFGLFVWKEKARDEREGYHKLLAGRVAFFAGANILVIGIIVQSFTHSVDPWLVATFSAMILAKIAGSVYGRMKH